MKNNHTARRVAVLAAACLAAAAAQANNSVHTTYLWHMHQPIYWPKSTSGSGNGYEKAKDTMDNRDGRGGHPSETLSDIFGLDDKKASYQYRLRDATAGMNGQPDAGAQCTFSGSLIQNIKQLGDNNWNGYSPAGPSWAGWSRNGEARTWKTSGNKPRLDFMCIPAHHPIAPFCTARELEMEIAFHKRLTQWHYGDTEPYTKGFYPPEMCFSERIIPTLVKQGFNWVVVANNHISRSCPNFPVVQGSGGEMCDPPNPADQVNANGANWFRKSIDRGCSPCNAAPLAMRPHYARFYDPNTAQEYKIIVVPAEMALSWDDGYSAIGTGQIEANIAPYNESSHPSLVLFGHDGDNAWGGGYSYYHESVPNFTQNAANKGYKPTTVEQYLLEHPLDASDVVHVEDGGWVNADGDFGSPQMINWTYFLQNPTTFQIDIEGGWHYKLRDYAIRMAALNWVLDAEAKAGTNNIDIAKVAEPYSSGASSAEKAWHFYLGSLDSGFQYYGNPGDNEVRVAIACNEAYRNAQTALGADPDRVAPTVWTPQRYPYNPGGKSFGPQTSYVAKDMPKDFYVWTFAYDRSGISSIKVCYRTDKDGANSTANSHNETFTGGSDVNAWQEQAMTDRGEFPKTMSGFGGLENISYELPTVIAHHYWTKIVTQSNTLYDYYIVANDTQGHSTTSDIQHVYVGNSNGGGGGDVVSYSPNPPVRGQNCTITYNSSGRNLASANPVSIHLGFNQWDPVLSPDAAMSGTVGGNWTYTFAVGSYTQVDCVFNNGSGTWDNNGGADWHKATVEGGPVLTPSTVRFSPANPASCDPVTITYSPYQTGLTNAAAVYVHLGYNGWATTMHVPMTASGTNWVYATETLPQGTTNVVVAFNDQPTESGNWDNNDGANWAVAVTGCVAPPSFPYVTITNPPGDINVAYDVSTYPVAGTCGTGVVGHLQWANSLGGSGALPVSSNWGVSVSLSVGTNLVTVTGTNAPAGTVTVAQDNASNTVYSAGWTNGMNGGTGWGGGWILSAGANAGFFRATTAEGNLDVGPLAWGLWANSGSTAQALRDFASAMTVGQVFSIQFDNNYISNGYSVGVGLQNSASSNLFEFMFIGGGTNYVINDSVMTRPTGIPHTSAGLNLSFELTGANTYKFTAGDKVFTGTLMSQSDSNVRRFKAWNYSSGPGSTYNFYLNQMALAAPGGAGLSTGDSVRIVRAPASGFVDTDADGIDDTWEAAHGLTVGVNDAALNPDNDPLNNGQEYIADLNPFVSNAWFRATLDYVGERPAGCVFEVTAGPPTTNSRVYDVFWCSNLLTGAWNASGLRVPGRADGGIVILSFTNALPNLFFHSGVRLP